MSYIRKTGDDKSFWRNYYREEYYINNSQIQSTFHTNDDMNIQVIPEACECV